MGNCSGRASVQTIVVSPSSSAVDHSPSPSSQSASGGDCVEKMEEVGPGVVIRRPPSRAGGLFRSRRQVAPEAALSSERYDATNLPRVEYGRSAANQSTIPTLARTGGIRPGLHGRTRSVKVVPEPDAESVSIPDVDDRLIRTTVRIRNVTSEKPGSGGDSAIVTTGSAAEDEGDLDSVFSWPSSSSSVCTDWNSDDDLDFDIDCSPKEYVIQPHSVGTMNDSMSLGRPKAAISGRRTKPVIGYNAALAESDIY